MISRSTENTHETREIEVPKGVLYKLKTKWGLESLFQVILVLLVFAITGTTVVFLRKTIFEWVGLDDTSATWLKTVIYILFVFPAYQALLLFYGSLFGQFNFFWSKEKKLFKLIAKSFKNIIQK